MDGSFFDFFCGNTECRKNHLGRNCIFGKKTMIILLILLIVGLIIYYIYSNPSRTNNLDVGLLKIQQSYSKAVTKNFLTGGNWLQENTSESIFYTFRGNDELLITVNGIVKKAKYEFIIDNNSIIISQNGISKMFVLENSKDDYLYLKDLNKNEVLTFVNQTKVKNNFIREQNLKRITEEALEKKRRTDEQFRYNEMINSTLMIDLDKEKILTLRISNHPEGIFGVINNYLGQKKSQGEIIADFKRWQNGDENLSLFNYIHYLDDNYDYNFEQI